MKCKKRKKGFYKIVAEAIVSGAPFDVSDNGGGWTKVQELITLYMLRDLNEADKFRVWSGYLARVQGIFDIAVKYINDDPEGLFEGKHVYKSIPEGKKNIQFLSIKTGYRESVEKNTDRLIRRIENVARPAMREIRETQAGRLKEGRKKIMRLLT